jgi:hypothetical protein
MTPTPTTDSAVSPVSDERLREILAMPDDAVPARLARSAITELLSRRSLDTADGVEPVAFTTQRMLDAMREPDTICGSMWPKAAGDVTIPLYLASRTPNTGTVVKALEWSSEPPYSVARVFRGFYSTEWVEETQTCELRGTFMRVDFPTVAEAKAAAQANHERHVLACLASPPSPAEVTDMEGAVRALHEALGGNGWAYTNYGNDELHSRRSELEAGVRAVLEALQLNKKD